nr:MAG TPA: hypothetical protein [Caudoviricetes sp.]
MRQSVTLFLLFLSGISRPIKNHALFLQAGARG